MDYLCSKIDIDNATKGYLWEAIHSLQVMPSMRALMTACVALDRDNTADTTVLTCLLMILNHSMKLCIYYYVVQVLALVLKDSTQKSYKFLISCISLIHVLSKR